jgi:hypothetical protein
MTSQRIFQSCFHKPTSMDNKERTCLENKHHFNLDSIQAMDEQEGKILEMIHSNREPIQYVEELVARHTKTSELHDEEDEQACKTVMVALRHFDVDTQLMLKLISMIISHFADPRESFVDRACFLATSLYKKDEFGAQTRKTFGRFEALLPRMSPQEKKHLRGFKEISNQNVSCNPSNYDSPSGCFYDDPGNPIFLQRALKILKSSNNTDQLRAVHLHFKSILDRTTQRTFRLYSEEVFNQLLDLSNSKVYDEQFKSLAYMISKDISLFDRALDRFKNTSLDTMRTYLLYAFDMVHDLVGLDLRVSIHLKFAEMVVSSEMELDEVTRNQVMFFVGRGMEMLQNVE